MANLLETLQEGCRSVDKLLEYKPQPEATTDYLKVLHAELVALRITITSVLDQGGGNEHSDESDDDSQRGG